MRINPSFAQQGSSRSSLKSTANALNKPLLYGVMQQFHVTRSRSNFHSSRQRRSSRRMVFSVNGALSTIEFGTRISQQGFNLFVIGPSGMRPSRRCLDCDRAENSPILAAARSRPRKHSSRRSAHRYKWRTRRPVERAERRRTGRISVRTADPDYLPGSAGQRQGRRYRARGRARRSHSFQGRADPFGLSGGPIRAGYADVAVCEFCLEQSYWGVEGDSASSAELYALLSALAEFPIRQDLAVTGSVNQRGQVQAIGGVNEKIEGFFDICQNAVSPEPKAY